MTTTTKRPRRTYGSGSVFQRGRDGHWVATVCAGFNSNGTRRRISVSGKTEPEAKARLKELQRQLARDEASASGISSRATVKAWADEWLEMRGHKKSPNTMNNYRSICSKWIIPTIGHRRLSALTPADVRALHQAHRQAGNTTTTANTTHVVFMAMLAAAVKEGHHIPARVLVTDPPGVGVNDREGMTTVEAIAVLNESTKLVDGSRWAMALVQGLRQGECLGLRWDAVDLDAGLVHVSWQLQALVYKDRAKGTFRIPDDYEAIQLIGALHLVRPKSDKGWRVVPLVRWMVEALRAWKEVAPYSPHNLVWPRLDGRPVRADQDLQEWYGLQGAAGVGHPGGRYYVLHEARYTTATLLMELRVDAKVIQAILGHASIVTSRGYMHVEQTVARQAMDQVAEKLQIST